MTQKKYIREIVQRTCLPSSERKRLKADLQSDISTALEGGESLDEIMVRMGEPDRIAAAIYESYSDSPERPFREYQSETTLFGFPLVHVIRINSGYGVQRMRGISARGISMGGRSGSLIDVPTARGIFAFGPKAKGFVAVGNFAAGFLSIGNLSAGVLAIGNLSAGLLSLGNLALALFMVFGNLAAGYLSFGNMAVGYAAAGNLAIGHYAVGNEVRGAFTFAIDHLAAQFDALKLFWTELSVTPEIKGFWGMTENIFKMILDPAAYLPQLITLVLLVVCLVVLLCTIPRRLIRKER